MSEPQQPTEEQVKSANDAELKRWEGDFDPKDLKVPYSRDEVKEPETPENKDESATEEEEPEAVEEHDEPASVVITEDPGKYEPADYSFEVTDKDGRLIKINSPEEADNFAEDDENFKSAKDLKDFLRKSQKMENQLDSDKAKWEAQKKEFDSQSELQESREKTVESLVAGFGYLVSKGLLPKVEDADAVADWSDPEVAKHPGVKEQIELINYMTKENAAREKAGVPILGSALDAYNAFELEQGKKQAAAEHKATGEARKVAGARVAGVSASNQAPYVPQGIAVGRVMPKRSVADWA